MRINYFFYLLIFLLASCNIREQSSIQEEVQNMATEDILVVDAQTLLNEFATDSASAADKYLDKVLSVTGEVGVFEQLDTIKFKTNDSIPIVFKWLMNRLESDINTSNILFKEFGKSTTTLNFGLNATFAKEYRNELTGIKKGDKVTVKGKLEHVSQLSQKNSDDTKQGLINFLCLQGCVLD